MSYSPLTIGTVYLPSEKVLDAVTAVISSSPKDNLALGLMAEYVHDEAFRAAGLSFEKPITTAFYDRKYQGVMQDDKLATFKDGKLSTTHTISKGEYDLWVSVGDATIMSWEMFDDDFNHGFRFCGMISFALLLRKNILIKSKNKIGDWFFDRFKGLKHAGLVQ